MGVTEAGIFRLCLSAEPCMKTEEEQWVFRVRASKGQNPVVFVQVFLLLLSVCHSDCNCCELEWGRGMKLNLITGNDVQVQEMCKRYEPNWPDGGAVIKTQKFNYHTPHTVCPTDTSPALCALHHLPWWVFEGDICFLGFDSAPKQTYGLVSLRYTFPW